MVLSTNINTREYDKFTLNSDLDTAVRTVTEGVMTGTFSPSGLSIAFLVTTMDVIDTETLLPATALTNRNAVSIINLDPLETLYIGNTGVVASNAVGTTSGWPVGPLESFNIDIKNNLPIYAIAPTSKTIRVKILEVA